MSVALHLRMMGECVCVSVCEFVSMITRNYNCIQVTFTHFISQRLFSNGGNYCREEVEFFDKKLVRIITLLVH